MATARNEPHSRVTWLFVLGAVAIATAGALPYAGGWNDGSRLAAVESIADQHTLAIDRSIFVQVPPDAVASGRGPYAANNAILNQFGTCDKLFIDGHFYSDKPYLISVLMAGWYRLAQQFGLPAAALRPDLFCLFMTLSTAGLAYVVAVWSIHRLAQHAGLQGGWCALVAISFALATVALPYTRHVNNHIMLLAVMALLMLHLVRLAEDARASPVAWLRLVFVGTLAGLAYNLDLGAGPVLLMCLLPLVIYRTRRLALVAVFLLALLPWLAAHHSINYAIGGAFKPINAVPEYAEWPGSPFTRDNLTGLWRYGPLHLGEYGLALLFGKHGFIGHNLPLFLLLPALFHFRFKIADCRLQTAHVGFRPALLNLKSKFLNRQSPSAWPELLFGLAWCCGTWLLYAALSTNSAGLCCSIRWFVPFLAPAYYGLAVLLCQCPVYRNGFCILSGWGLVPGAIMWWYGPWIPHMVPLFWPIQACALLSWLGYEYRSRRLKQISLNRHQVPTQRAA